MNLCFRAPLCGLTALVTVVTFSSPVVNAKPAACSRAASATALTSIFRNGIDGLAGADYQRAIELPDGRVLWVLQDAFVRSRSGKVSLAHNVGVVQAGRCATLLRGGTQARPQSWIGGDLTTTRHRWFWLLGGGMSVDGTLRVFAAEMRERGTTYLSHTEPVATWMATIDPVTLNVVTFGPAPDHGADLYGWAVASDSEFTYLFGYCYRQFGFGMMGHDACAAEFRVARVPLGEFDTVPSYWSGADWVADNLAAGTIAPRLGPNGETRDVNPVQVAFVDGAWLAVTKVGDWWGTSIYLDRASSPTGPWTTTKVLPVAGLGPPDQYNTYFASFVPGHGATSMTIGLSNNRWDGRLSNSYRPTFMSVPLSFWNTRSPQVGPGVRV
jgi:hypothetical protein